MNLGGQGYYFLPLEMRKALYEAVSRAAKSGEPTLVEKAMSIQAKLPVGKPKK